MPQVEIVEETVVIETGIIPAVPAYKITIQMPLPPFAGPASVNRDTLTVCASGTAFDQNGQGPVQVWAEVYANDPEPIAFNAAPDPGAVQGVVNGRNWLVDPVPNAICAEPPNPPIIQYIVVWVQYPDGSWRHHTQQFSGQCADTNDCGD
jgi:hypothetical protein